MWSVWTPDGWEVFHLQGLVPSCAFHDRAHMQLGARIVPAEKGKSTVTNFQNGMEANTEAFVARYLCQVFIHWLFFWHKSMCSIFWSRQRQNLSSIIRLSQRDVNFAVLVSSQLYNGAVPMFVPAYWLLCYFL